RSGRGPASGGPGRRGRGRGAARTPETIGTWLVSRSHRKVGRASAILEPHLSTPPPQEHIRIAAHPASSRKVSGDGDNRWSPGPDVTGLNLPQRSSWNGLGFRVAWDQAERASGVAARRRCAGPDWSARGCELAREPGYATGGSRSRAPDLVERRGDLRACGAVVLGADGFDGGGVGRVGTMADPANPAATLPACFPARSHPIQSSAIRHQYDPAE